MSLVIDASVLVAALTDAGEVGCWAEQLIGEGELVAPHLVLVEAANVLRRLELAGEMRAAEASAAHEDLLELDLWLVPYAPYAQRIWALRDNVTGYDAWYVAVAEVHDLSLATLDVKLARAPGPSCGFRLPEPAS